MEIELAPFRAAGCGSVYGGAGAALLASRHVLLTSILRGLGLRLGLLRFTLSGNRPLCNRRIATGLPLPEIPLRHHILHNPRLHGRSCRIARRGRPGSRCRSGRSTAIPTAPYWRSGRVGVGAIGD